MKKCFWLYAGSTASLSFALLCSAVSAAAPGDGDPPEPVSEPTYFEQNVLVRSGETIQPLGPDLMGDQLNEFSGGLQFSHTDVSLPGNSALQVAVRRKLSVGSRQPIGLFGDWDLDIPRLHTVALAAYPDWYGRNGYAAYNSNRCSQFVEPPVSTYAAGSRMRNLRPETWWDGYHLSIPGAGDQTMLSRAGGPPTSPIQPSDGAAYPVLTKQHWQFSCLPSMARGSGEGFLARSPDGTRYQFDHMAQRPYLPLDMSPYGTVARVQIWIMPTLITDRFGNWVRYTYGGTDGWRPTSIMSSDGRSITFTYLADGRIQSVSDGTRSWSYAYDAVGHLQTVTQPDGSQWTFSLAALKKDPFATADIGCGGGTRPWDYNTYVGTVTHPSGATGSFTLKMTLHGRTNVPGNELACEGPTQVNGVNYVNTVPRYYINYALASKTLSGPGMPAMTWSYAYSNAVGRFAADCNGCVGSKTVTINDPQGAVAVNTYGTGFAVNEGLLLSSTQGTASTVLRTTSYAYRASNAGPYPAAVGYRGGAADSMSRIYTPQSQRTIAQQGVNFSQIVTGFDGYARPTGITRSSSLGTSRSESTTYHDHTGLWVLGQIAGVVVAGNQASATSFYANTALPSATYKFGKLRATYGFHGDGTLADISDGLNRTTRFTNYSRGLPRNIGYADGTGISAVVNNIGTIASVTNEAGTTWSFGYDAMGRLSRKTPPSGDSVAYNPTYISFVQVPVEEHGIEPNHWRQIIDTGLAQTINYFDARWRKRLSISYDTSNAGQTIRVQRFEYDAYNRPTFTAYPARSTATLGVRTSYDALGRVVRSEADSELGTLTTATAYLDGFLTRVTNPRGHATTSSFQVFDEPSESAITSMTLPEGVNVAIARDLFSKPLSVARSGTFAGAPVSATRSYVYDQHQLLCKTIEPETGATVQEYDSANNVAWRANGLGLTGSSCDRASVPDSSKVAYAYDARNRLTGTGYGDGSPSVGGSYTADGLPQTVVSNGATWTYGYNNRRLLTSETLAYDLNYVIGRSYNANGHLSAHTYPYYGIVVPYAPNALGEPTQVGGYASGITHHPNGAVAGYTLGNGIVHTLSQNTRGLPRVNRDAGVIQDQYDYDANGNVSSIADQQEGITSRSMSYDGLDRLLTASAPAVWGTASYGYDPLDNLRTSVIGSRNSQHSYDAANRLSLINNAGVFTGYAYDARGNVTGRGSQGYYFDLGNRMTTASGLAIYSYDGHGRRVHLSTSNGVSRSQVYDSGGKLMFGYGRLGGGSWLTHYIYLGGKLIAETDTSYGTTYHHTDALGSPVARTNAQGQVINRTRYEPYGATAAGTNPGADGFTGIGYTGHVNDADTGLVYMQQRYYDPIAGRFQSVDPVVTDGNTGASFSRYSYVENNPYRYTDPNGRQKWETACTGLDCASVLEDLASRKRKRSRDAATPRSGAANAPDGDYLEPSWEETAAVGETLLSGAPIGLPLRAAKGATTVIGRVKDLKALGAGEKSLLDRLPKEPLINELAAR